MWRGRYSLLGYGRVMWGLLIRDAECLQVDQVLEQNSSSILEHEAVPLTHPRYSVLGATSRCQGFYPGEPVTWARVPGQVPPRIHGIRQEWPPAPPHPPYPPPLRWEPSLTKEFTVSDLPGPWEPGEFRRLRWHLDVCGPVVFPKDMWLCMGNTRVPAWKYLRLMYILFLCTCESTYVHLCE